MIDRVYKFIQTVSNNELNGNISPQEFKLLVNNSVDELYESNLQALKTIIQRERRDGRVFSIENISGKVREKIMHYYFTGEVSKAGTKYVLPENLKYLDTVEYEGIDAEPMQNRRQFKAVSNFIDTKPSLTNPIYLKIANELDIAPTTITGPVTIYYLRNATRANWTYSLINGVEIFNPDASDYADIDIHPSEEYNLSVLILQKLGVNLKEPELTQYGLTKENSDFQKDNIN